MLDTPVFGIFHRARPAIQPPPPAPPEAAPAELPEAVPPEMDITPFEPEAYERDQPVPSVTEPEGADKEASSAEFDGLVDPPLPSPTEEHGSAGPLQLSTPAAADQLGLANPLSILLHASLPGSEPVELDPALYGLYRPTNFRPAPWSGFAYDQASSPATGIAAGSRLLTARGEIEVEKLLPGDSVLALRGPALLPVAWIGQASSAEAPIVIEAGALGPNRPHRRLCVAPEHPVFVDPDPVPARSLLNGSTIYSAEEPGIDLFHIDVGTPEVLFAEGVPLASSTRPAPIAT